MPAVVAPVVGPVIGAVVATVVVAALLLTGCAPASPPGTEPVAGGPTPTRETPPAAPMDGVERSVTEVLAARVRDDGLTLQYLSCPDWHRRLPAGLTCTGWFDGVQGTVAVRLHAGRNHSVVYDATLTRGVVATNLLVARLLEDGYVDVDCGTRPAYPATVGENVVCLVTRDGEHGHVVATVTDPDGSVVMTEK